MNNFVADPHWGGWVIAYFFLGGIAAGSYFLAVLIEWFGKSSDRVLAKIAYRIALPLILICGILLIVDLHRPERFWHMLFKSEWVKSAVAAGFPISAEGWRTATHALSFKYWSPMSLGSWGLTIFGACTFFSFVATVWPRHWPGRWFHRSWLARILQLVGCISGFFVASYTGALLSATNQPVWSDTIWLGALFLTSSVSTSLAAMMLLARWRAWGSTESQRKLARMEPVALLLELLVVAIFLWSLNVPFTEIVFTWQGMVLLLAVLVLGALAPIFLHWWVGDSRRWAAPAAAGCILLGGLLLRVSLLEWPDNLLPHAETATVTISPEDGRARGGGPGADIGNYTELIHPRSKLPINK